MGARITKKSVDAAEPVVGNIFLWDTVVVIGAKGRAVGRFVVGAGQFVSYLFRREAT